MHDPGDFFDADTGGEALFQLEHIGGRQFKLLRQFGYVDLMPPHNVFKVPRDVEVFRTDLASTPDYFTWLIPGIGEHLPAILLHDGLIFGEGEEPTYVGPKVCRSQADRMFRDSMKALGTGPIRRWMIWAAVTLATAWEESRFWQFLLVATAAVMMFLGTMATLDLIDIVAFYPWMSDKSWGWEVVNGGIAALIVPFVISLPWLLKQRYPAMVIATLAFALLIHVTLVIMVLLALYKGLEVLARWLERILRPHQISPAPKRVYEQRDAKIAS
jgi:Protein of unknown function (DUF1353)